MNNSNSFFSDKKFIAKEFFPYGISRSGDFTLTQVQLIEQHGHAYSDLYQGLREPINTEESEFIEVFKGNKEASTSHELVWKRFLDKTQYRVKVSSFSTPPVQQDPDEDMSDDEEW